MQSKHIYRVNIKKEVCRKSMCKQNISIICFKTTFFLPLFTLDIHSKRHGSSFSLSLFGPLETHWYSRSCWVCTISTACLVSDKLIHCLTELTIKHRNIFLSAVTSSAAADTVYTGGFCGKNKRLVNSIMKRSVFSWLLLPLADPPQWITLILNRVIPQSVIGYDQWPASVEYKSAHNVAAGTWINCGDKVHL